jgi:DNA-binding response OmpR family regulator
MDIISKHILIIDNDAATRKLFGALLSRVGFEVLYAKDGNEGHELAKRIKPDLILLDINMPIMDGWETANKLKSSFDSLVVNIPIAFLTNEDLSVEDQNNAKKIGVIDYIQKGASNDEFIERVKKIIEMDPGIENVQMEITKYDYR